MNAEITFGLTRDVVQLVRSSFGGSISESVATVSLWIDILVVQSFLSLTLHQVLWLRQQRRRWRRRSAASSGQSDDFGGVDLPQMRPDPSSCVAASAVRRLAQALAFEGPWRPGRGVATVWGTKWRPPGVAGSAVDQSRWSVTVSKFGLGDFASYTLTSFSSKSEEYLDA